MREAARVGNEALAPDRAGPRSRPRRTRDAAPPVPPRSRPPPRSASRWPAASRPRRSAARCPRPRPARRLRRPCRRRRHRRPTGPPPVLQPNGGVEVVAQGLQAPWSILRLPAGGVLVSERDTANVVEVLGDGSLRVAANVAGRRARRRGRPARAGVPPDRRRRPRTSSTRTSPRHPTTASCGCRSRALPARWGSVRPRTCSPASPRRATTTADASRSAPTASSTPRPATRATAMPPRTRTRCRARSCG